MVKKMKSKKILIKSIVAMIFLILSIVGCSEILLISITVSYPFDKNNPDASPSEYKIDINDGLGLLDSTLSKQTKDVTEKISGTAVSEIENDIKNEFGENTEIVFDIKNPLFKTDDFIDLISGKNVIKTVAIESTIQQAGIPDVTRNYEKELTFSICDFDEKNIFSDDRIRMDIININDFCKKEDLERENTFKFCLDEKRTVEDLKRDCVYLKVSHENEPVRIALSEVKDLQKYSGYLDKIYSATLNDLTFSVIKSPDFKNDQRASAFILEAELFSQPVMYFLPDGSECPETNDENCIKMGVNEDGEVENYFSDDPEIKEKYLIGYFGADSFEVEDSIELLYSYHGKNILQKSIKSLDFQIGAKSYYIFFPQAGRPDGELLMDIKAKLLFTVEPLS